MSSKLLCVGLILSLLCWQLLQAKNGDVPAVDYQPIRYKLGQIVHCVSFSLERFELNLREDPKGRSLKAFTDGASLVAINGGLFSSEPHYRPAGVYKRHHRWHDIAYQARGALGILPNGRLLIDRITTDSHLLINDEPYPVHVLNQARRNHQAVLFTNAYPNPLELRACAQNWFIQRGYLRDQLSQGLLNLQGSDLLYARGKHLPRLQAPARATAQLLVEVKPKLDISSQALWRQTHTILGSGPVLINQGKICSDYSLEKLNPAFIYERHARTAIGIRANNQVLLVVTEQDSEQAGMTLAELSDFLKLQGCHQALNLDGGSSSGLYLGPGIQQAFTLKKQGVLPKDNSKLLANALILQQRE